MYAHFKNSLGLKAETFFLTSQVENVAFAIRKLNFIQCAVTDNVQLWLSAVPGNIKLNFLQRLGNILKHILNYAKIYLSTRFLLYSRFPTFTNRYGFNKKKEFNAQ